MKKLWERYSRKKHWWSIALDFLFILLLIGMLIPATRKPLSAFLIRQTLFSPSESDKVVYLEDKDWRLGFVSLEDGQNRQLKDFKGKPVFLNFWATWCPPCVAEMPTIQDLYNDYKDEVAFVLISNESTDVVNTFMKKHQYTLPLYSLRSNLPAVFKTSTIPTTFLIAPSGRVVISKSGAAKWDSEKIRNLLKQWSE